MPDEKPIRDPFEVALERERDILYTLTDPEDNRTLWTIEELAREMEDHEVLVSIRGLQRAGLAHRTADGHVFASLAAVRHIQMVGRVI